MFPGDSKQGRSDSDKWVHSTPRSYDDQRHHIPLANETLCLLVVCKFDLFSLLIAQATMSWNTYFIIYHNKRASTELSSPFSMFLEKVSTTYQATRYRDLQLTLSVGPTTVESIELLILMILGHLGYPPGIRSAGLQSIQIDPVLYS